MNQRLFHSLALATMVGTVGCQSPQSPGERIPDPVTVPDKAHADISIRNNALALLENLLGDEKDVDKVLYLKSASDATRRLLKDISATTKEYHTKIEAIAQELPEYDLKNLDLPPGELAARKAESKTEEHVILHSHGADFQFEILLSQAQGLDYGTHLAQLVADNETDSVRAGEFSALAQKLNALFERTALMLKNR